MRVMDAPSCSTFAGFKYRSLFAVRLAYPETRARSYRAGWHNYQERRWPVLGRAVSIRFGHEHADPPLRVVTACRAPVAGGGSVGVGWDWVPMICRADRVNEPETAPASCQYYPPYGRTGRQQVNEG
jgi:hypothetical protein